MVLTLVRWSAKALLAPRLKASIGITTAALWSRPPSGLERAGPLSGDVDRGTARAPGAGKRCQVPRRDRHPGEVARVAIGACRGQVECRAACGDGARHRHCPADRCDKLVLHTVLCPLPASGGPSPLFPERPNPAVHPPQPAILRAELPLRGCPRHPSDRGSPPRLRAPVERASWPSFLVFSRGDGPPASKKGTSKCRTSSS